MKFEVTLTALKEMKYKALGMGREELIQGLDLLTHHNPDELPFVCANARLAPSDLGLPLPFKIVEAAGLKIAVTGVIGEKIRQAVIPKAPLRDDEKGAGEVEAVPAADGLKTVFPQMEAAKPDLYVLLSHGETDEGLELARLFPKVRPGIGGRGARRSRSQAENGGDDPRRPGWCERETCGRRRRLSQGGVEAAFRARRPRERALSGSSRMRELMKAYQDEILARNLSETESSVRIPRGIPMWGRRCAAVATKRRSRPGAVPNTRWLISRWIPVAKGRKRRGCRACMTPNASPVM